MNSRYLSFISWVAWWSTLSVLAYHWRFLLFAQFDQVSDRTLIVRTFYFLTGLGHESFAIFFVVSGIRAGYWIQKTDAATNRFLATSVRDLKRYHLGLIWALFIGAGLDLLGKLVFNHAGFYDAGGFPSFGQISLDWLAFLGNLFMLQPFVVPTFGSNGMLYLLSYLFWAHVLLFVFACWANRFAGPIGRLARYVAAMILVLALPRECVLWMAIWFTGVAVAALGENYRARPSLLSGLLIFGAAIVLSRAIGSDADWLPEPFGAALPAWKYFIVAAGFALIALSVYPDARTGQALAASETGTTTLARRLGRDATFIFFFHLPFVMLLGGVLFDHAGLLPSVQPGIGAYTTFAVALGASLILTTLAGRAIDHVVGVEEYSDGRVPVRQP